MIIATWNVNSLKARMPRVEQWLADVQPDILCMQETKMKDSAFPALAFQGLGYETVHHGFNQWNGVAILSKVGIEQPVNGFAGGITPDPDARLISATCGGIRVHSVYVPNGREVGHDHFHYKLSWLDRLVEHLDATCRPSDRVVVAGDWNIAPSDQDVWNPRLFETSTHVTPEERSALDAVKDWGLVDTFRARHPEEQLFSYYDYQAGRFHKREGMRIDFLLASEPLAEENFFDLVDRNGRKGTKPSDHAPVLAGFRTSV
ncbi:MAG: exodeoxyribonuclease III [Acidimicrobiales bacterium]|nr:exodeoxyribonuclease III [Acidimicrobiales bacterium]